jgi:hypothetical protein
MTRLAFLAAAALTLANAACLGAELSIERNGDNVRVLADGELFAEYVTDGPQPYVWPIIGPTGKAMTRAYPMKDVEGERKDHPHHRSLWFTHGNVNGVDFWAETRVHGEIKHREFLDASADGRRATIKTTNDWIAPDGKKHLEDERTLVFRADDTRRAIDFTVVLKAVDGPVTFGDTKEGSFAVRIPTSMDVDSKLGGKITNSHGLHDKEAWGQRAEWVDYHGPVEGDELGVAIFNHPSSFRFPTPWHVRTYGLFAANPFGLGDFDPSAGEDGAYTLPEGETLTLRYLVLFHKAGDAEADMEQVFERYSRLSP